MWRGGASILMRGILAAYCDQSKVWEIRGVNTVREISGGLRLG